MQQCDLTLADLREFTPDGAWERSWGKSRSEKLGCPPAGTYQDLMEVPVFNEGHHWERMRSCQHVREMSARLMRKR